MENSEWLFIHDIDRTCAYHIHICIHVQFVNELNKKREREREERGMEEIGIEIVLYAVIQLQLHVNAVGVIFAQQAPFYCFDSNYYDLASLKNWHSADAEHFAYKHAKVGSQ